MGQPKAQFLLARHEHGPSTMVSCSSRPEHKVELVLGRDCNSARQLSPRTKTLSLTRPMGRQVVSGTALGVPINNGGTLT
jgi:hypothetical protein